MYRSDHHAEDQLTTALPIDGTKTEIRPIIDWNVELIIKYLHHVPLSSYPGMQWYIRQMPTSRDDDIVIEKSPPYMGTQGAADRIKRDLPSARFIWVICDPVRRAVSDWLHVSLSKSSSVGKYSQIG